MIATPYLFFKSECREALEFYKTVFGGKLELMTYGDAQGESCPLAHRDRVMHGSLSSPELILMASDDPKDAPVTGTNVHICLTFKELPEIERVYKALSAGGKQTFPLHDAFWGDRFGTLTDKYGFLWMLTCPAPKKS